MRCFSSDVLSKIIRFYGNAMQGMMGNYLEKNIQTFIEIQKKLQEQSRAVYGGTPAPGLKTFHVDAMNQNFYSLPLLQATDIHQRLALIDQLLEAAAGNSAAQDALRSARGTLTQLAAN